MTQRIDYYCKYCGKLRQGPLPTEANNLNYPCSCGKLHWTTEEPKTKVTDGLSKENES